MMRQGWIKNRAQLREDMLNMIFRQPGITQRELSDILHYHHTYIRKMANQLIKEQEIIRTFSLDDKREVAFMQAA